MKKLAIITTHPIQYYAPVFRLLHERGNIDIKVYYTWGSDSLNKHDPGFSRVVDWDIPLLEGYPFEWVKNTATDPGSHHFMGIITPGLTRQLADFAPDAILVFGWAYHSHLQVIRRYHGRLPVYFRGDSTLLDESSLFIKRLMKTTFLKWVYRHIDHAFFVGTNNKAYFKKYGLKEEQLSFAPHAVDNNRFAQPRLGEAENLRIKLKIRTDEILILFAGKLEPKKGTMLLMETFLSLNPENCHLLFVGSGSLAPMLQLKAKGKEQVHFLDFQNQSAMPVLYQACDIFCLPSSGPGETWGLAVNEAMACGKPIIVSDKVGCGVDLVSAHNGVVFKAGDLVTFRQALTDLLVKKRELAILGQQSLLTIKEWTFKRVAEAIEQVLLKYPRTNH
ncbi:Glycosyltransferase involved in cell wall bisynthesis [Mucilaginibacter pineti]|uniref:Glycosyltransferase involved in cell wall bisynthesis n=1 Tax=Mucilaginibacter pineti TaxID=1391627 RepID=A0A1G6ZNC1_9SPHI|nr:glycosyltransferase family 4 protein [Mucilaginibacter pineti]SDE04021.1 Glycosyltransferase involved in cell wall bisynthesis [Mucilaginibacter pineti]